VRLEEKIRSLRQHVEELKARLLWSNIMIIVLLLIILYELIR
jgi:Sec-independent protein secretion pathway component TatC